MSAVSVDGGLGCRLDTEGAHFLDGGDAHDVLALPIGGESVRSGADQHRLAFGIQAIPVVAGDDAAIVEADVLDAPVEVPDHLLPLRLSAPAPRASNRPLLEGLVATPPLTGQPLLPPSLILLDALSLFCGELGTQFRNRA